MDARRLIAAMRANPDAFVRQPYTYSFLVTSVANGASATQNVSIEANSPFVWEKSAYFCDIAGAVQTDSSRVIPLVSLQLTDSGSGRQLFDRAQPIPIIAGEQGIPALLSAPYVFDPNSSINGVFANYSNATTYANLYFTMIGYRVFEFSKAAGI
jgi:hypothetical protein